VERAVTAENIETDTLIEVFEDILETPGGVRADSNFFLAGGDSLLATRVISRLRRKFHVDVTFAEFTQAPTPRTLRELLISLRGPIRP
jgi:aryl carrier-like protein